MIQTIVLGMLLLSVAISSFRKDKIALPLAILLWGYLFILM